MIAVVLLICGSGGDVKQTEAAWCEVNHYYDDCGRHVFDQIILWDERGRVIAWRLWKADRCPPWRCGSRWKLRLDGRLISVPVWWHTWTQYDPEMADRAILPVEQRRGLR